MGANSNISWTTHTFNPWIGCTKVSPGCLHCYAETLMDTRYRRVKWGAGNPRVRTSAANWKLPIRWNKTAPLFRVIDGRVWDGSSSTQIAGQPETLVFNATCGDMRRDIPAEEWNDAARWRPRVFCASLADWLDAEVPIEWLVDLLALIKDTPDIDWILLTKRPENFKTRIEWAIQYATFNRGNWTLSASLSCWINATVVPANVWIGTTVEDQTRADIRIPQLLAIPARVRFLSCEPMLERVDILRPYCITCKNSGHSDSINGTRPCPECDGGNPFEGGHIQWVIIGGESGTGAREFNTEHAWELVLQCRSAGVATFVKQLGSRPRTTNVNAMEWPDGTEVVPYANDPTAAGGFIKLRDRSGTDMAEFPTELRAREMPGATT